MPYNKDFKGSFLSFTFNGQNSSNWGIVRTMDGGLEESLLPPQDPKTAILPGREGDYFLKSHFQSRVFNVNFAFDNLTDKEFQEIRHWLGDKKEHPLYFSESPYKVFNARVSGELTVNYVPFDGPNGRVYKGSGSVEFTAHYPYGKVLYKDYQSYQLADFPDKADWQLTANLKTLRANNVDNFVSGSAQLYNPGFIKSPLIIYGLLSTGTGRLNFAYDGNEGTERLVLDMTKLPATKYYQINSENATIRQVVLSNGEYVATGPLYNEAIIAGDFFFIEPENGTQKVLRCSSTTSTFAANGGRHLGYDYYYL